MKKKTELERAELEEQVLRLRASNLSLRKIADKLGISRETVSGILKRAMKARNAENVSDFRAIALSRLDLLASAALPAALKGDTRSIDSVSKITTEQAKLLNAYDVRYFDVKIERENKRLR
jgi:DNA-binding CsgD family transcriptional regulator